MGTERKRSIRIRQIIKQCWHNLLAHAKYAQITFAKMICSVDMPVESYAPNVINGLKTKKERLTEPKRLGYSLAMDQELPPMPRDKTIEVSQFKLNVVAERLHYIYADKTIIPTLKNTPTVLYDVNKKDTEFLSVYDVLMMVRERLKEMGADSRF